VKLVFPHHQTWFPHIGLGHGSFAALAVEFLAAFGASSLFKLVLGHSLLILNASC
jgi:hypothetical protein